MIFTEQISRKPDRYPWAYQFIEAMWAGHWTPNEFDFQSDIQDFKTELTKDEQNTIINTLSAIGQIEIAVKKFWSKLGDNLPHPSLSDLGYTMCHIEVIHGTAYSKLLDALQLQNVFEENLKLDIIIGRVNYLRKYNEKKYSDNKKQYIYSLILFTLFIENVSLFSQFYIVLWFSRFRNVLKDTSQQVQYTKNEETLHAQAGIKIIQTIKSEHPDFFDEELQKRVTEEAMEAFKAESKIIDWMLGSYEGECLTKEILKEYVKNRINVSLDQIGFGKVFEINEAILEETFWMEEEVLGNSATDFFFKRPTEYSKNHAVFSQETLFD
jgi:ribonucleoside-diphosphate reductase beta chain